MRERFSRIEKSIKKLIWQQNHSEFSRLLDAIYLRRCLSIFFNVTTTILSLGSLLGVAFYYGLYNSKQDLAELLFGLHFALCFFTLNIALAFIFDFRKYILHAGWLKWLVIAMVLLSSIGYIFGPFDHTIACFIDDNNFLFASLVSYSFVFLSAKGLDFANKKSTNPSLILATSFLLVILIGTFMFMLPKSTKEPLDLIDAFFVATSAVCVTGLTPVDIAQTFTNFGLLVLAILIQLGGLGLITFTSVFAIFYSGTNTIYNQLLIGDMVYSRSMDALLPTLLYILGFTLVIETIGAGFIYLTTPDSLFTSGSDRIIFAFFHSMSAFCNAGFSNIPQGLGNAALLKGNQFFYLTISALMFFGSIGFPILINFKDRLFSKFTVSVLKMKPKNQIQRIDLNTKLVLWTSLSLVLVGTVLFFCFEYNNTLKDMGFFTKVVQSIFNAILPRTTGFASVDPSHFASSTVLLVCTLMWIGGSSQSMAGGVKVNTVAVILLSFKSVIFGKPQTYAFDRSISDATVLRAFSVATLATILVVFFTVILTLLEPEVSIKWIIFEVMSALFTVGSSMGLTAELSTASKLVICLAMFVGRIGLLSLLMGLLSNRHNPSVSYPAEKVIIN